MSDEYNLGMFCDVVQMILDAGGDPKCGESDILFHVTRILQVKYQMFSNTKIICG